MFGSGLDDVTALSMAGTISSALLSRCFLRDMNVISAHLPIYLGVKVVNTL